MDKEKEKYEKKSEEEYSKNDEKAKYGEKYVGGYVISNRTLWLMAGGALGALAAIGIGKISKKIKPEVVGAVKEGYAFKEWTASKIERAKEDMEDIVAEAKHEYYNDLQATAETVKKEKELLQKVEEKVEEKIARQKPEEEGE